MFPLLFKNIAVESFHCDTYEIAKHHHVSFPLSNTKSFQSFFLVHTDVWARLKFLTSVGLCGLCLLLMIALELHDYI